MELLDLHPLNHDFSWQSSGVTPRRVSTEQRDQFDREGFFLYRNGFDAEEVAAAIEAIAPLEEAAEQLIRSQPGAKVFIARADAITFTAHLVPQSDVLKQMSVAPVVLDLCHDLIGPDVRLYWDQAVYKKPSNPDEFPFHQDNGYTFTEPQQYLTCWVALTDATIDNGCPWVLPGAHLRGTLRHEATDLGWRCIESSDNAVPVEAAAGDIVVFSSLTPHRTGPNLTDDVRKSYILQYAPDGAVTRTVQDPSPVPQDDPHRQYRVLVDGHAVAPPA